MPTNNIQRDRKLFALIAEGNATAFTEVFRLYYDQLRFNALRILKSEYWAEEVVQEAFAQIWTNRATLIDLDAPVPYLFRMVANRCFDRIRKNELDIRLQYSIGLLSSSHNSVIQPHDFDLTVLKKLIKGALEQLSQQQKIIYELQSEELLSYQEIADKLGLSRNTVRNHMAKAIQSVRSYIKQHGSELFFILLTVLIIL